MTQDDRPTDLSDTLAMDAANAIETGAGQNRPPEEFDQTVGDAEAGGMTLIGEPTTTPDAPVASDVDPPSEGVPTPAGEIESAPDAAPEGMPWYAVFSRKSVWMPAAGVSALLTLGAVYMTATHLAQQRYAAQLAEAAKTSEKLEQQNKRLTDQNSELDQRNSERAQKEAALLAALQEKEKALEAAQAAAVESEQGKPDEGDASPSRRSERASASAPADCALRDKDSAVTTLKSCIQAYNAGDGR